MRKNIETEQLFFHGIGKRYPYFEGWYLKHQYMGHTVAFIPAVHAGKNGQWTASIQVITEEGTWNFNYPAKECRIEKNFFCVKIGNNLFTEKGINVRLQNDEVSISGRILYSEFHRLESDIMGIFRYLPFMQCSHGVLSMAHSLRGHLCINGEKTEFTGGRGYAETDWGKSFPKHYIWSQCEFGSRGMDSIMVSVADVPLPGKCFRGCICAAHYQGREYRLATYRGAKIKGYGEGKIVLRQGRMVLIVTRMENKAFSLHAPREGRMERIIRESPACKVHYQLRKGKKTVFNLISSEASFEQA